LARALKIAITEEADLLRRNYLLNGIVSSKYESDALHVALATSSMCDAIVSWNFKHIVNMDRIRKYNAVNILLGYNTIGIHTPGEVLVDEL
jgi:hypothetical protein